MIHENRETWLAAAVKVATPLFETHGYKVPAVRVACGWPSKGALAAKKRRIGECWPPDASTDGLSQIFVSPFLACPIEILGTLVHEVVHAVVGNDKKHGKVFGKCARLVGLEGKLTATVASPELIATFVEKWLPELGEFPHAKLDLLKSPVKKQTTRMVKCECGECGYVCRTTKKWLEIGPPHCPVHGAMKIEESDDTDETDTDEGGDE